MRNSKLEGSSAPDTNATSAQERTCRLINSSSLAGGAPSGLYRLQLLRKQGMEEDSFPERNLAEKGEKPICTRNGKEVVFPLEDGVQNRS